MDDGKFGYLPAAWASRPISHLSSFSPSPLFKKAIYSWDRIKVISLRCEVPSAAGPFDGFHLVKMNCYVLYQGSTCRCIDISSSESVLGPDPENWRGTSLHFCKANRSDGGRRRRLQLLRFRSQSQAATRPITTVSQTHLNINSTEMYFYIHCTLLHP